MSLPPEDWPRPTPAEREIALTAGPPGEGTSASLLGALGTALTVARDPAAIAHMQRLVGDYVSFLSRMLAALEPNDPQGAVVRGGVSSAAEGRGAILSERELAIVRLLAGGHAVGSIARLLDLSAYTVRNHLKACYRKLGLHSQIEIVNYAFAHGLVPPF